MFLLQFSSVYNACGLASYDLFDEIDFDLWFTNQLLHELNNSSSRYVSITSTSAKHLLEFNNVQWGSAEPIKGCVTFFVVVCSVAKWNLNVTSFGATCITVSLVFLVNTCSSNKFGLTLNNPMLRLLVIVVLHVQGTRFCIVASSGWLDSG